MGGAEGATLSTRWVLWFHDTRNNNWTNDSYAILDVASEVDDVRRILGMFGPPAQPRGGAATARSDQPPGGATARSDQPPGGATARSDQPWRQTAMLFYMREFVAGTRVRRFIYPTWEDPNNRDGGVLCAAGAYSDMSRVFWDVLVRLSGDSLVEATDDDPPDAGSRRIILLNGVSIAPKGDEQAVVKVWYAALPDATPDSTGRVEAGEPVDRALAQLRPVVARAITRQARLVYFVAHQAVKTKDTARCERDLKLDADRLRGAEEARRRRDRRQHNKRPQRGRRLRSGYTSCRPLPSGESAYGGKRSGRRAPPKRRGQRPSIRSWRREVE